MVVGRSTLVAAWGMAEEEPGRATPSGERKGKNNCPVAFVTSIFQAWEKLV